MNGRFSSFHAFLQHVLAGHRDGGMPDVDVLSREYPQFAEQLREELPSVMSAETAADPLTLAEPTGCRPKQIAGYRIQAEIGRGGMGVVYEAQHDALGRHVALKVLSHRLTDSGEATERFRREARAIARLHHTNIVPLFEVGDDAGQPFLAMQLISGQSLHEVIRNLRRQNSMGSSSSPSALDIRVPGADSSHPRSGSSDNSGSHTTRHFRSIAGIGLQIADALHYAHDRGIIHRDVKPSNLLVDENGVVWLTDFGLAKTDEGDLTQTGDFVGTLKYMAPERFAGQCDVCSDVYALGLTLYELITLRPAFDVSDRLKLIYLITSDEPPRPRDVAPQIPRDLETIVLKAIDKSPGSRYRTARAFADDLERYLQDRPITARRHSVPERLIRWSRRNRSLALSIAGSAAMAVMTIVVLALSLRTANNATAEARAFAARALLTQADSAFDNRQFQSAAVLATASLNVAPSDAAEAKLQSARASSPARLRWMSPTLSDATAIAGSPNGQFIAAASASEDYIWVWDSERFSVKSHLAGHHETITSLAFHPDHHWLLSGSKDQTVRLWDFDSGEIKWEHSIHATPAAVAVDRTARYAAAGGVFRGTVYVWDCVTGRQLHHFKGTGTPVQTITFSDREPKLAAGFSNGEIYVWDLENDTHTVMPGHASAQSLVFLSGDRLAAGTETGLSIWNTVNRTEDKIDSGENGSLTDITALAGRGSELAVANAGGVIQFRDAVTLRQRGGTSLRIDNPVSLLAYGATDQKLIVGSQNAGKTSTDLSIRVLDRSSREAVAWTEGHVEYVTQLVFDSDGRRLVSAAGDRTIRVWDAGTGDLIARLAGHAGEINGAAISSDGKLVASCGADRTLRLWSVDRQAEVAASHEVEQAVQAVAFHPDGQTLFTASKRSITAWKIGTDSAADPDVPERKEMRKSGDPIFVDRGKQEIYKRTLTVSPDGGLIACGMSRGSVVVYSADSGELVAEIQADERRFIEAVQFSADGKRLAVKCHEYRVRVYDLDDCESPREIGEFVQRPMKSMSLSPGGDLLVTGAYNKDVILWSVDSGIQLSQIEGHRARVSTLAFSPNGHSLASSSGGEIRMWDVNVPELQSLHGAALAGKDVVWDDHYDMLFSFNFSSDENLMFIKGMWDGAYNAVLLDRTTGARQGFKFGHGGSIDPHDRWLAMCTRMGDLDLIDLQSGMRTPLPHDGRAMKAVVFNADGSLLAGGTGGNVAIWDVADARRLDSVFAHSGNRTKVLFHPVQAHILASTGSDGIIYLWDVSSGKLQRVRKFDGHTGRVGRMAFSKDGKYLASGGYHDAPAAVLWEVESGEVVQRFRGHAAEITAVDISPDGRWLASSSGDYTVRLWDIKDGTELRRFQEHTDDVYCVRFIRNGSQLISASADGTIRFRDLKQATASGPMTPQELEAETGLHLHHGSIQPIPRRVLWRRKSPAQTRAAIKVRPSRSLDETAVDESGFDSR